MKKTALLLLIIAATPFVFNSNNAGVGSAGNKDRTGGPFSSNLTCGQCHSSSTMTAPQLSITLLDAINNSTSSYIPGQNYTLQISVSSPTAISYGFQAVALDNLNNQAGSFTVGSSNTRITNLNSRQYPEQLSKSPSGIFTVNWQAPSSGTGDVTFYACGNAVNNNNSSTGDKSTSGTLTVNENLSGLNEINTTDVRIYPNPATDYFQIESSTSSFNRIRVYDLNSRLLIDQQLSGFTSRIAINELPNGTYLILIENDSQQIKKLLLKL